MSYTVDTVAVRVMKERLLEESAALAKAAGAVPDLPVAGMGPLVNSVTSALTARTTALSGSCDTAAANLRAALKDARAADSSSVDRFTALLPLGSDWP